MIANARMYAVSPEAAGLWRALLSALIERAGVDVQLLDHAEPAPIDELWQRSDKAAVFMCGLPFSRAEPRPILIAAAVPSPSEFHSLPQYWSDFVVSRESGFQHIEDTFGGRIALTVPDSQSGCVAALRHLMTRADTFPLYQEVIGPQVTPLGALQAVIEGAADVAPIDSYALRLMQSFRRDLTARIRVIGRTAATPIPPLVASSGGLEPLQSAFIEAHQLAATRSTMRALLLERFVRPDPASYDELRAGFETAARFWREHSFAAAAHPAFAAVIPTA
jgi:ABC-type phosphate/phosphonate transport system substrate-binding protein